MTDEKIIKDAQYRKGLSIAFFNAINSAIALVSAYPIVELRSDEQRLERVFKIRDKMLEEHKNYYITTIAKIGVVYNASETIKKLNQAKNRAELRLVWISISEDERHDGEIRKVVEQLKSKLK